MELEEQVDGPCSQNVATVYKATTSMIDEVLEGMYVVLTLKNYGYFKGDCCGTCRPTSRSRTL